MADPHEIVNVCGIAGLDYMMKAAENTVLDVKYELPSCVPATPFEHSGAVIDAEAMKEPITREGIAGLGEFMNFPGVINAADSDLDKIIVAKQEGKFIDGHGPGITGKELNAYAAARIAADHECSTVEEMSDRLERGMYILLRQGSACHNLRTLLKGVTAENSRRCLLCSDDRQPKTILHEGHLDNHLRICVEEGLDPVIAIRMATLNAAECFDLKDRGAIAPGYRGDVVLLDDLKDFHVNRVFIEGALVAEEGKYLPEIKKCDITFFDFWQIFSFFCYQGTFYKYTVYMEIFQIIQKNNIPTVSRCNCSSVFQVKAFCCVKCCHTNCYHRIKTFLYTDTQMIIKMSFVKDCLRLTVIRTEQASSAVLCCHTFKQCSKVMAC